MSDTESTSPAVSVIVATRDRPERLAATLRRLERQGIAPGSWEIVVVDDGSSPAVSVSPATDAGPAVRVMRLAPAGRSAARNAGGGAARGQLLVFVDDDIEVDSDFVARHRAAHVAWGDVLVTGAIQLPEAVLSTPFGRFRHALEQSSQPVAAGPGAPANFAAAGNLSIARNAFLALGGFDPAMVSAEDQDLALRFSARGGRIAYLPEAVGIHRDAALDIRSYCARAEWGMEHLVPFLHKHPSLPENIERLRVNGPLRWSEDGPSVALRKAVKGMLAGRVGTAILFGLARALEGVASDSRALDRLYLILLGVHLARGLRRGLLGSGAETR